MGIDKYIVKLWHLLDNQAYFLEIWTESKVCAII